MNIITARDLNPTTRVRLTVRYTSPYQSLYNEGAGNPMRPPLSNLGIVFVEAGHEVEGIGAMSMERSVSACVDPETDSFQDGFGATAFRSARRDPERHELCTTLDWVALGNLDVVRYEGCGVRGGRRDWRHIREDGVDDFYVILPLTGPAAISQSGRSIIVEPGACTLLATIRPFAGVCGNPPNYEYSEFVVRIPGPLLRQHIPHADTCCARPISVCRGTGKILWSLLEALVREGTACSGAPAERFGKMVLFATVNTILGTPGLPELPESRQSSRSRVFERAKEFIESQLSDPALDPARIAQHCRISVSYLHAAFAAHSHRVGTYIRELRLQRCREALQNPFLSHQSIIEIAMRWGFNSAPGFTRAYRALYGRPPSEERMHCVPIDALHY